MTIIHKRILFYASLLAVVIVLILYHGGVPFEKSYNGILYSNEDAFEQKTTIKVEGELYKRLSGKHRIVGNVTVDEDLTYRFAADLDGPE
ncbi:hypothetical protein M3231_10780 [Neobacillus mesonae]|nr:hypothetical protein [Neobacillus mesonae]